MTEQDLRKGPPSVGIRLSIKPTFIHFLLNARWIQPLPVFRGRSGTVPGSDLDG